MTVSVLTAVSPFIEIMYKGFLGRFLSEHEMSTGLGLYVPFVGSFVLCAIVAYLIGSINFGIIISGSMYGDDVRNYGSGNAGTTNMLRTYGAKAAILTFVGDFLKAALAVMLARLVMGAASAYVAALFCVIGHSFPVFHKFKGGKGVASAAGVILMLDWRILLILIALFLIIVAGTRFVSLGSIIAIAVFPILTDRMIKIAPLVPGFGPIPMIAPLMAVLIAVLVIYLHRANLKRLFSGTESKISFAKKKNQDVSSEDGGNAGN